MQGSSDVSAEALLTVSEAAGRLRVSPATVYALCAAGKLPHVRVSTHAIRILERDIARFIAGATNSG
jgi:excisionase family DNA binding protein